MTNNMQPGLSGSDLAKGLDALEQLAGAPQNPRRAELFEKAQSGDLSSAERVELMKSLEQDDLATEATEPLTSNPSIKKSIDVSDYLREQNRAQVAALEVLAGHIEKSQGRDHEFRVALAQTLVQIGGAVQSQGEMIKSMQDALSSFGMQPARAPKSAPTAASAPTLVKSFAGGAGGDQLSKAQIEDAMGTMLEKGMSSVGGEPLLTAASKYEMFGTMSGPVLEGVRQFINSNHAA